MKMHRVEIRTASGYGGTFYIRDAGGAEFKEASALRARVFAITGEFPIETWTAA